MAVEKLVVQVMVGLVVSAASFDVREAGAQQVRRQSFDSDPGWEAVNNRIEPTSKLVVKQDFGYSATTNFAGKTVGEVGGSVQRSTTPAYYALPIKPKTLSSRLSAAGSFAVAKSGGGAGVFFGFFNSDQPGGSGRPIGSLGLDFDFEQSGGRLAVRLITSGNKTCGTFITPYLPGKFRPTPIRTDGTRYFWMLNYDPHAADGRGQFTFTMVSAKHTDQDYGTLPPASAEEARARFPNTKTFTVDLPEGFKKEDAVFDRFGLLNMMKSGGTAEIYFDDIVLQGNVENFSGEPKWIGSGNRKTYEDREQTGAHDYGFSPTTNHAGGAKAGEAGGGLWRSGALGYYADKVGPLDLTQKLTASGKVRLVTAGPDSDVYLGWFNSGSSKPATENAGKMKSNRFEDRDFIGIHVGGPTRVGHYFIPQLATAKGSIGKVDAGPVLLRAKSFDWSLTYDPEGAGGKGSMRVTLGDESVALDLKPGQKAEGAVLDRFGIFTTDTGGQMVKIYIDDLIYVAAKP